MAFPLIPVHTFPGSRMSAMMIETIQIEVETSIEPPACLATRGTVARIVVVVAIFGGECRTTMIRKRVASSSYKVTQKGKNYTMLTDIKLRNLVEHFGNAFDIRKYDF